MKTTSNNTKSLHFSVNQVNYCESRSIWKNATGFISLRKITAISERSKIYTFMTLLAYKDQFNLFNGKFSVQATNYWHRFSAIYSLFCFVLSFQLREITQYINRLSHYFCVAQYTQYQIVAIDVVTQPTK